MQEKDAGVASCFMGLLPPAERASFVASLTDCDGFVSKPGLYVIIAPIGVGHCVELQGPLARAVQFC